jgi:hypothetical protein
MRARENFGRSSAPRLPQAVQTKSGSISDSPTHATKAGVRIRNNCSARPRSSSLASSITRAFSARAEGKLKTTPARPAFDRQCRPTKTFSSRHLVEQALVLKCARDAERGDRMRLAAQQIVPAVQHCAAGTGGQEAGDEVEDRRLILVACISISGPLSGRNFQSGSGYVTVTDLQVTVVTLRSVSL